MKKIVFFVPCFASGGAEAFIVNVAENMDRSQFEPMILSIDEQESVYDERLKKASVKRIVLIKEHISNPVKRYLKSYKIFKEYLKENGGEIFAIHFNIAQGEELPFISISKKAGIKIRIMHSHNSSVNSRYKYYGHVVCKKLYANTATHYFACSDLAAAWLVPAKRLNSGDYTIIQNGIDTEKYRFHAEVRSQKRMELGIGDQTLYLNIGRLGNQKNQTFLLKAYAGVSRTNPASVLLIVGEGALRQQLEQEAADLKLTDRVRFLGNRTDIPQLLCAADLFLLPSLYEGLPYTLVEAQNAGLPCIVSDTVSEQCALTDLVQRIPLDVNAYSNAVLHTKTLNAETRDRYPEIIQSKGFDIHMTVKILEKCYHGEN